MVESFKELIPVLRNARSVTVLTGAGISAESDIPTFRDAMSGLWARFRPEELATPEAFMKDPKLVWDWYQWRRELVAKAEPNSGHYALADIERKIPNFTLITQNVDGLHQRAGSQNVIEVHGNIHRVKCFKEGHLVTSWEETEDILPRCPRCNSLLRPDVVWFGETLPEDVLMKALDASADCDVYFSIGTSALVQPAASFVYEAIYKGAVTVEVNIVATEQARNLTFSLEGSSGEILPALIKQTWP